jgi:hypothetical protein
MGVYSQEILSCRRSYGKRLSLFIRISRKGLSAMVIESFSQFVSISKSSVGEARGQLLYAVDFGYLEVEKFEQINSLGLRASQCLGGLMRHLNTSQMRGRKFKPHESRNT